jgi:PEP-CTERM motif-containing protein
VAKDNCSGCGVGQGVNFLAGGGTTFSWFNGSQGVTFPSNGQDFSISVPASLDIIAGTILATCSNVCQTVSLTTTAGTLTLSFFYSAADGMYYGTSGSFTCAAVTTVPEPGTLGLMVMGVVAVTRRRLQQRRA